MNAGNIIALALSRYYQLKSHRIYLEKGFILKLNVNVV